DARKSAGIRSVTVRRQKLEAVISATATVRPNGDRLAHVGTKVTGRIVKAPVLEGAQVKAGDTLLALDSIEVGAGAVEFLKARSALEVAKINFDREEEMMKGKITTAEAYYAAKGAFIQAEAERQATRDKLLLLGWPAERVDKLRWDDGEERGRVAVQAPIEGEVIEKHATLGEVVTPETNLFTIADLSSIWLIIDVYQGDVRNVHEGQPVEAVASGHPGRVFKGKVTYVGKVVDEATRTLKVRVALDNADRQLRPGMFVTARIYDEDEHAREMTAVPAAAIQRITNIPVVFLQKAPGLYEKRALTLGRRYGDYYEVLAGLEGGETIITEGSFILKAELLRSLMEHAHEH
ncbi:MAG TPA: efflux RND transporter periplasmic adaptor subunit, partial [Gemmatimonadales bacterium]|nr:efflux RND transporter periplasmic adaptor subunit [Gemmatimonadales bacterium]